MTAEQQTQRLSRLAALAAEADQAVQEAVGNDLSPLVATSDGPLADAPPTTDPTASEDTASEDTVTETTVTETTVTETTVTETTAAGSDDADADLIAMASGLDADLEPEPKPTPVSDTPTKPRPELHTPLRTESKASPRSSIRMALGIALVGLLAIGTFAIMRGGRDAANSVAASTSAGVEIDTGDSRTSESAIPVRAALRLDGAGADVDLQATVGTTTEEVLAATAWELVGSEPGTAMFADLIDSEWLRTTFEQTRTEAGEPVAFTFFSPSDAALAALGTTGLNELVADPAIGREFINSHIVDVQLTEAELRSRAGTTLIARSGSTVSIEVDGQEVLLNGQAAVFPALVASNGTVIIIDDVLHRPDS